MKTLIIGANGQLGADIVKVFRENSDEVIAVTHDELDISIEASVQKVFEENKPDVIINTAAFHNVEGCEQQPEKAFVVNSVGSLHLARYCAEHGSYLIHVSTDYVFNGEKKKPYIESDCAQPLNIYGISKLAGEQAITASKARALVVRTCGLYGLHPCRAKGGINFVERMLQMAHEGKRITVVDNEYVSPTFTMDLARQLFVLSRSSLTGICHASAEGSCTWYEFADEIFRMAGVTADLHKAEPGAFSAKVNRPTYSVLENDLLNKHELNRMSHWKEGLHEYLSLRPVGRMAGGQ